MLSLRRTEALAMGISRNALVALALVALTTCHPALTQGAGVVVGVDALALTEALPGHYEVRTCGRQGVAIISAEEPRRQIYIRVCSGEVDTARWYDHPRYMWEAIPAKEPTPKPVGDDSYHWGAPALAFRRANVVCMVMGSDLDDAVSIAQAVDREICGSERIAPRGERVAVPSVALKYPSEAAVGSEVPVDYSVSNADSIVVGLSRPFRGVHTPEGRWTIPQIRGSTDMPGVSRWTVFIASNMCIVVEMEIRIKVLPAEDGHG